LDAHYFVKVLEALAKQVPPDSRIVLLTGGRLTAVSLTFRWVAKATVLVMGAHYHHAARVQELIHDLARVTKGKRMSVMVSDSFERSCPHDKMSCEIHQFLTEPEIGKFYFGNDFYVVIKGRLPDSTEGKFQLWKTLQPMPC